jgi:outer membrane receptor protein involved in Fe transport
LAGDSIPSVPKYQASLGLTYLRPIAKGWDGMVATDVTYRSGEDSYFASNAFNIPLQAYALVGLRMGVIEGPWSVTGFARNLTNKRAQVSAINSSQDPDALLTVQPRTVGLTLTRKF